MSSQVDFDANAEFEDSKCAFYSFYRSSSIAQLDANNVFHIEKLTSESGALAVVPQACSPIKPTVQKPTAG